MKQEMSLKGARQPNPAQSRRRPVFWIFIAILVLVGALVAFNRSRQSMAPAGANAVQGPAASPSPAAPVEAATAAAITRGLSRGVEVVGSLMADEEVVVSAQAAGELAVLNVDFGSFVKQGQVLAQIDQRDARLKVEQAEAALKQTLARLGMREGERFDPSQAADVKVVKAALDWAKLDLERSTKLVENGDVARAEYDQRLINYTSAQARYQAALDSVNQQLALVEQQRSALALARKAVVDTVVVAPISGAVKEKQASRGTYLPVNGKIVTLVKIDPLRLRADIPEYAAAAVRSGQTMTLAVESFPGRTFNGRVVRIGPALNEQTRALTVEAEVRNPGYLLRPGMFAKSRLITAQAAPAVMVPQRAVVSVAGLNKVFVIENGKAVERIVKTGAADGDLVEIAEGVKEAEVVAVSNLDKLQTGTLIAGRK
ncbi:MAG TPA: efflux RND transporter periplasmic adaptor subunit [Blastocatellia bacterium]|nr:efflux RND transporter periplasmic adaptor subunit [Blastocatellia bacterium]